MRIAILGATSQIAKDLILSFAAQKSSDELVLFARRPDAVAAWLARTGLSGRYAIADFGTFGMETSFDALLNFVGVGNPAQAAAMGTAIFDITLQYDEMALHYQRRYPDCRYIFLSSGAAYGGNFEQPADENTRANIPINDLQPQDWYAAAKLHAECRHRSLAQFPIVDLRVFNYFSRTQDLSARFFITDLIRSICSGEKMITSPDNIMRDYLGPDDFSQLVSRVLAAPPANAALDCYTLAPTDKMSLLRAMQAQFGLAFEVRDGPAGVNATGMKMHYFSTNRKAAAFGYQPSRSSLDSVMDEARIVLNRSSAL
ncbi:nucleoside-diphosphate-sugar epimerase [Paucimonas lemoignei]|uniref:Nucleoside-diphosphate-sugar epimerase n=1 Tax=Paucimonas lemoignei TaxID=29443 RepID=A0A4V2UIA5_PAULE|nr:NAD(P)-dependent oxidoreductase [Paucimonas lemoignei]TCS35118.1 nucleoside-diphosphate-sugar epimerase [Paucimonas lemoignei]